MRYSPPMSERIHRVVAALSHLVTAEEVAAALVREAAEALGARATVGGRPLAAAGAGARRRGGVHVLAAAGRALRRRAALEGTRVLRKSAEFAELRALLDEIAQG
jgi:hypothetical protein